MAKVRCKYCKYEESGRCIKKKSTVKLNKRRKCELYSGDQQKIAASEVKINKAETFKVTTESSSNISSGLDFSKFRTTVDMKHPLTGNLNKFIKGDYHE